LTQRLIHEHPVPTLRRIPARVPSRRIPGKPTIRVQRGVDESQTGDAIARRVTAALTLYAPYVLDGEVVSALLGLMRGQKISEREADAALSSYRAFPVERQDVLPLWPRLKSLHANLSAYDAQYVALAEALHVPLVTADARVKRSGAARCEVEVFDVHT
jgi:predicted nucleic acid-binding protein